MDGCLGALPQAAVDAASPVAASSTSVLALLAETSGFGMDSLLPVLGMKQVSKWKGADMFRACWRARLFATHVHQLFPSGCRRLRYWPLPHLPSSPWSSTCGVASSLKRSAQSCSWRCERQGPATAPGTSDILHFQIPEKPGRSQLPLPLP